MTPPVAADFRCPRRRLDSRPASRRVRRQAGYVTAEAAIVIPLIALFALALVWAISLGVAQIRAVDAARDTARAIARGDEMSTAIALGHRSAPQGSHVTVARDADVTSVNVDVDVEAPGWLLVPLPDVGLHADAHVLNETIPADDASSP